MNSSLKILEFGMNTGLLMTWWVNLLVDSEPVDYAQVVGSGFPKTTKVSFD